jgi:UDP-N-acetylmuramoyl-tripeptide--D-alanyl-D-alanine ligase
MQHATAFVNGNNALLIELSEGINCIYYGNNNEFEVKAKLNMYGEMLGLDWEINQTTIPVKTKLVGSYNFDNALAAICVGKYFGVNNQQIAEALMAYEPTNSRSQSVLTGKNRVILDAYNANPSSMKAAIENFVFVKAPKRMVILGDMLELGTESQLEHKNILGLIEGYNFDEVLLIGPEFASCASAKFRCFNTSDEALTWLKQIKPEGYAVLVKGSRGIRTEKVMEAL